MDDATLGLLKAIRDYYLTPVSFQDGTNLPHDDRRDVRTDVDYLLKTVGLLAAMVHDLKEDGGIEPPYLASVIAPRSHLLFYPNPDAAPAIQVIVQNPTNTSVLFRFDLGPKTNTPKT